MRRRSLRSSALRKANGSTSISLMDEIHKIINLSNTTLSFEQMPRTRAQWEGSGVRLVKCN